ncbi:hypothetical protein LT679_02845 [Mucilaginibacter roseus]|uniref:Tetratricopeptide repeat protein n=1 Tax=Mucilaginibacter roseus TaxID=1528868 RepID=A0ABS8TZV5_9SPHI|nr:hypothetical protein [Mucilaginibacter roseus]MCD8739527.1 hypothetical protein [Mucilaginibacter roseus]
MKKLFTIIAFAFLFIFQFTHADDLDSLRRKLKKTTVDSLRAPIHLKLVNVYMHYDTVSNPMKKAMYQNEAQINCFQALHLYSGISDTTGMRISFDKLSQLFYKQKKYSQAKWYALQSNNLSRIKNDVPNIIASLQHLAAIKTDIKEYKLAERDLKEALYWSEQQKSATASASIKKDYAKLNKKLGKKGKTMLASTKSKKNKSSIKPVATPLIASSDTTGSAKPVATDKKPAKVAAKKLAVI